MYLFKTFREEFYNDKEENQVQHKQELNEKSVKTDKMLLNAINDIEELIKSKQPKCIVINGEYTSVEDFENSLTLKQARKNLDKLEICEYSYFIKSVDKTENDSTAFRKDYQMYITIE